MALSFVNNFNGILNTNKNIDAFRLIDVTTNSLLFRYNLNNLNIISITSTPNDVFTYTNNIANKTLYISNLLIKLYTFNIASNKGTFTITGNTNVFSPLNINSLNVWLDAKDPSGNGTILQNNTKLLKWQDKSLGKRIATSHDTKGVLWTKINGQESFYFDGGINSSYNFNSEISVNGNAMTIFIVSTFTGGGANNGRIIGMTQNNTTSDWNNTSSVSIERRNGQSSPQVTRNSAFAFANSSTPYESLYVTTIYFDGTKGYINSLVGSNSNLVDGSFNSTGNFSMRYYSVGSDPRTEAPMTGYVSEIIISVVAIPFNTRQKVEGYLSWKWGLEGKLPSTHPYYSSRP